MDMTIILVIAGAGIIIGLLHRFDDQCTAWGFLQTVPHHLKAPLEASTTSYYGMTKRVAT